MRIVLQRVSKAEIITNQVSTANIQKGLFLLVGMEDEDTDEDLEWVARKISKMRIFPDENDKTNLSVADAKGNILIMSQFTLFASTIKGNRPSFIKAGKPDFASRMYDKFYELLKIQSGVHVQKGNFGSYCSINLTNDGPTTILLDTKRKE